MRSTLALVLTLLVPGIVLAQAPNPLVVGHGQFRVVFDQADAKVAQQTAEILVQARDRIVSFFGSPFEQVITVQVLADRAGFDRFVKERWTMPATECWMIAAADASAVPLLSPRAWPAQACEHDAHDARHVAGIVTHELVHAYHGQHNAKPDLSLPDDMGWFAEGLATYVAGQLEEGHLAEAADAIRAGKAPRSLAEAWAGKYRYGVSGTLVEYVDRTAGREAIRRALPAATQHELLATFGLAEDQLIEGWRRFVLNGRK